MGSCTSTEKTKCYCTICNNAIKIADINDESYALANRFWFDYVCEPYVNGMPDIKLEKVWIHFSSYTNRLTGKSLDHDYELKSSISSYFTKEIQKRCLNKTD
jgi:hypothetical protein